MAKKIVAIILALLTFGFVGLGIRSSLSWPTITIADAKVSPISTTTVSRTPLRAQDITLTILPHAKLGPNGQYHNTVSPADFTLIQDVPSTLSIANFDTTAHIITNVDLGLRVIVPGAKKGMPGITAVTFTPSMAGNFKWIDVDLSTTHSDTWAMAHEGFMQGTIHVLPSQTSIQFLDITLKANGQSETALDTFAKNTDANNLMAQAGIPVVLHIENFDHQDYDFSLSKFGIQREIKGVQVLGVPSMTTIEFTPVATGSFHWHCTARNASAQPQLSPESSTTGTMTVLS